MLLWLGELTFSSWILSYGAEHLAARYGAKFVGRTLLSVATTLPEIAIVAYAAGVGNYGIAIGSGLGSNLMMMTLGLSVMLIIATTSLSKAPLKGIDVTTFKLDKIFLLLTAVVSAILFIDGYDYVDGFIFSGFFAAYVIVAFYEMRLESKLKKQDAEIKINKTASSAKDLGHKKEGTNEYTHEEKNSKSIIKPLLIFIAGTIGILIGAEPFIHSLQGFSTDVGISAIVLAVIISPIAGEMPEKISIMILARKGAAGASIAVANILGSKILNNTLLLSVAIFGAMLYGGFYEKIAADTLLTYQMILVTTVTLIALIPMFRKEIGLKVGIALGILYIISIGIQFVLPQGNIPH